MFWPRRPDPFMSPCGYTDTLLFQFRTDWRGVSMEGFRADVAEAIRISSDLATGVSRLLLVLGRLAIRCGGMRNLQLHHGKIPRRLVVIEGGRDLDQSRPHRR